SQLSLFLGNRLGAVDVLVLVLGGCGVEAAQALVGGGDVVPPAVLEIDQGLAVEVDRDDPADEAGEPLQLPAVGADLDILVGPFALQLLVPRIGGVHDRSFVPTGSALSIATRRPGASASAKRLVVAARRGVEVEALDELARLLRPGHTLHPGV